VPQPARPAAAQKSAAIQRSAAAERNSAGVKKGEEEELQAVERMSGGAPHKPAWEHPTGSPQADAEAGDQEARLQQVGA
jgi:hypothetical protein